MAEQRSTPQRQIDSVVTEEIQSPRGDDTGPLATAAPESEGRDGPDEQHGWQRQERHW